MKKETTALLVNAEKSFNLFKKVYIFISEKIVLYN